jgi:hypothetical protein
MSILSFQGLNDYYSYILSKVITSQLVVDGRAIKMLAENQKAGRIYATPLRFRDGAILRFEERILIDKTGQIERPFYTYHYERSHQNNTFYFRYDRDPPHAKPLLHEECHLHANGKVPRYKTHVTCFDEVFDFIVAGYRENKWQGAEWID